MMIAHSLRGAVFGPAQRLHGATYVVSAEFRRPELDADGIVVDIGRAADVLRTVLSEFNYRNLDDVPSLAGLNTTTEVMARVIFDRLAAAIVAGELGSGADGIDSLKVMLQETPEAAAAYEAAVAGATQC
jgi:6-pyruvoyl-tetrahydropterin synthase